MASSPSPSPGTINATVPPPTTTPSPASTTPSPSTSTPGSLAPVKQPNATPADPSSSPLVAPPPLPPAAAPPPQLASPPPSSPPPRVTVPPPPVIVASPPPAPPAVVPPPPVVDASPPPAPPAAVPPPPVVDASPPPAPPAVVPPPSPPVAVPPPPTPAAPPKAPPSVSPVIASPPPSNLPAPDPPADRTPPTVVQSPPPPGRRRPPGTPTTQPEAPPVAPPPSTIPVKPSPTSPSPSSGDPSIATPTGPSPPGSDSSTVPAPNTAIDPASPATTGSPGSNTPSNPTSYDIGPSPDSGGLSSGAKAGIGIVFALLVLSLVGAAFWYKKKRRRVHGYNPGFMMPSPASSPTQVLATTGYSVGSPESKESLPEFSMGNCRFFTYEELYQITNGFLAQNLLGEGGFGSVYKGCLADGREVAVKKLKDGGGQGEREFQAEVEIISRVHHRHLVSLVGYCIADNQRVLVYDYVPNNTLHYHLHGCGVPVLGWPARVKIAAGSARGLAYLHEDCHPRIIHRDIKSSNILLDNNFEAQVADFGLARLALDACTHVTTRVMGTFGYLAPEYASSGKLTERSDVFSFGVVLLELITGRKPVDSSKPMGDESLVEWARPLLGQALETGNVGLGELMDQRLDKNYNEVEMVRMIEAAAVCIRHSASRRPKMSQVVRALDCLADADLTNGVQPGQSELFNVADTAEIRLFQRMAFGSQDFTTDFSQSSWNSQSQSRGFDASGSRQL